MTGLFGHRVIAAGLAAGLAATLTVAIGQATALRNNPLAWIVVAVLITVTAAAAGYTAWAGREPASRAEIEDAVTALAENSQASWDQACNHRGLHSWRLIEVPWAISSYHHAEPDPKFRLRRTTPGEIKQTAKDLRAGRARVLIVGPAGAGKSSLALLLARAWLQEDRASSQPVPVLLAASSWTEGEPVLVWLERQLLINHRRLARRTDEGVTVARHLVAHKRVFPVVDGLDELPEAPRSALVEALRDALPEGLSLIVTCRTTVPRLPVDTVFSLRPVAPGDTVKLLTQEASDRQRATWERLITLCRKEPDRPLAQMLARPLLVALAAEVYGQHAPDRDPAELTRLPTVEALEDHILGAWLPTTLDRRKRNLPERRHYRDRAVMAWLTFLARHLERRDTYELRWWELRLAVLGRFRLPEWAKPDTFRPPGRPQRLVRPGEAWTRLREHWRRNRRGRRRRFVRGVLYGAGIVWAICGVTWLATLVFPEFMRQRVLSGGDFMPNLLLVVDEPLVLLIGIIVSSLLLGLILGGLLAWAGPEDFPITEFILAMGRTPENLAAGGPGHTDAEPGWAVNPRQSLAADRRWSLLWFSGATAGLVLLLLLAATGDFRQSFPLLAKVGESLPWAAAFAVLATGLGVFLRGEWPWFVAARATLTLAGLPPVRLLRFLDTMDAWDILRREGEVYRFRHATVRDWLLRRAALEAYRSLSEDHQRLLRRLAMHPGPDFTTDLVARLDDLTEGETRDRLADFVRVELLSQVGDRYRWRAGRTAIAELTAELDPPGLREQVLAELRRGYVELFTAHLADPPCPFSPEPGMWPLPLESKGWSRLREEKQTVLACLRSQDADLTELGPIVLPYLYLWGHAAECDELLAERRLSGLLEHRSSQDCPACRARSLNHLGVLQLQDDPAKARAHFESAAALAQEANARFQEATAQIGIGECMLAEAEFDQAVPLLSKGLATLGKRGGSDWAAEIGYRAARTLYDTGRFRTAERMIFAVLGGAETAEGKAWMAALHHLAGVVRVELDQFAGAAYSARQARERYLELEHPQAANALAAWAETLLQLGKSLTSNGADGNWATNAGRERLRAARVEFLALGDNLRAADMLVDLGSWADRDKQAREWLTDAIAEYQRLDQPERIEHARELLTQRSASRPDSHGSREPSTLRT